MKKYVVIKLFLLPFIIITLAHLTKPSDARIYIDITSPVSEKLPIAIQEFSGKYGQEISDIITQDLNYTGIFNCIDKNAHIEKPNQNFNPKNWTPLGVETVVKGSVTDAGDLIVKISLYDVTENKEVLRKEYKGSLNLLRPISHTISNDIYHFLTGQNGIFRTRIIFITDEQGAKSLNIMDWDGHRINKIGIKSNIIVAPHWSRDGKKLIYSAEKNRLWNIYLLDFKELIEKKIYSSKGVNIPGDFLSDNEITLSSSKDGSSDIYIMNLQNSNLTKITSSHGIDISPTVSPDSRYIAFVSDRGGSPQIYVMRRDGTDIRRITFEGNYNTSPIWSPKGDKIAFVGRRGTNQIFTINPDGTELTQLTHTGNNEEPSFSPDGMFIAFTSDRDGVKSIYLMRANGEGQKRITPLNISAHSPRWSPN
jgi:TolB protein